MSVRACDRKVTNPERKVFTIENVCKIIFDMVSFFETFERRKDENAPWPARSESGDCQLWVPKFSPFGRNVNFYKVI